MGFQQSKTKHQQHIDEGQGIPHMDEGQDAIAQELYTKAQVQGKTARQAFQILRGQHKPADIAPPTPCADAPPPQPNAYSDGSLHSPHTPAFSLGGAGVWHPDRQLTSSPSSEAEANLAIFTQKQEGLQLFNSLSGLCGSSTRAELAGAIIAFAANGPVHLGTDSQSFKAKAHKVNQLIAANNTPRRPWALQHDGDLWQIYYNHIKIKGLASTKITKVKGHATQAMVDEGSVPMEQKVGNDFADQAAEEGVNEHGLQLVTLGRQLAARHKAYTTFLTQLHTHICFMYRVRAAMLAIQRGDQSPNPTTHLPQTIATIPPYNTTQRPHYIHQVIRANQCPQLCRKYPHILDVETFLRQVPMATANPNGGFTWLELYTLYRLTGQPEPIGYQAASAQQRPTLRRQLHAFRQAIRQLVHHTMGTAQHYLFKGRKDTTKRLHTLGINTCIAILPWQPCLTLQMQTTLAHEVLRSQRRFSHLKAQQALAAHHQLPLRPIQLKGRARWSQHLKPPKHAIYTATPSQPTQAGDSSDHTARPKEQGVSTRLEVSPMSPALDLSSSAPQCPQPDQPDSTTTPPPQNQDIRTIHATTATQPNFIYLRCPRCPHQLPGTKPAFRHNNLDTRVWCNQCQKSLFIRLWQCKCGIPWHTCPLHKDEPQRLQQQQTSLPRTTHTPTHRSGCSTANPTKASIGARQGPTHPKVAGCPCREATASRAERRGARGAHHTSHQTRPAHDGPEAPS